MTLTPTLPERDSLQAAADNHQPHFGHAVNGPADTFAAHAAVLRAAVGHVVHPEGGHFVDHDAADFQFVPCLLNSTDVVGKDAGLQTVAAAIHKVDCLLEVAEWRESCHRSEDFFARSFGVERHVFEHGGFNHVSVAA